MTQGIDDIKQQKNPALVLQKTKDLQIVDEKIPELKENDVMIRTGCVGICGSDVHFWQDGKCGDSVLEGPMIMGHETSGVVCALGKNLANPLKIGDRVAIEPGIPCRVCDMCKQGFYNLCPDVKFHATPPIDGTLRKYFAHPSDFCHRIPDELTLEEGALIEPISVAMYAFSRGGFSYGDNVLICGAGTIGLCCCICALAMGAKNIYVIDAMPIKLNLAKKLGIHHPIKVDWNDKGLVDELKPYFKKHGEPNISFEATGTDLGIALALNVTRPGGKLVSIGFADIHSHVEMSKVICRQIDVLGVFRYVNIFPKTIAMVACKAVDVKLLITDRFDFKDSIKAYERSHEREAIKVMIKVSDDK